ncbi:MAG: ABC transporter permease [Ignavibacteriales bacterium]|nr:ABC transporter permease [Ignavibacteriales bacterium]
MLAYMAPGMALMFLMYTVSYGGRSILAERAQGTLPRLLVSPTSTAQMLGGKVLRHLPDRRGADAHPDPRQHAVLPA